MRLLPGSWIRHLPVADRGELAREPGASLVASLRSRSPGPLKESWGAWRETAFMLADPACRETLLGR